MVDTGDSEFKVGDRVTFWANLYCGKCEMCLAGKEHLCLDVNGNNYIGFVCSGGYAEYFVGKAKNAYKLLTRFPMLQQDSLIRSCLPIMR